MVRDRIPDIIKAKGGTYVAREAGSEEFLTKLKEKLREEVEEFIASESQEEMADIYEVIDALMVEKNMDEAAVIAAQKRKREEKGGFEKRIILESAEDKK